MAAGSSGAAWADAQAPRVAGVSRGTALCPALHPDTATVLLQFVFKNQFLQVEMGHDPSFQLLTLMGRFNFTRKQRQQEYHMEE